MSTFFIYGTSITQEDTVYNRIFYFELKRFYLPTYYCYLLLIVLQCSTQEKPSSDSSGAMWSLARLCLFLPRETDMMTGVVMCEVGVKLS